MKQFTEPTAASRRAGSSWLRFAALAAAIAAFVLVASPSGPPPTALAEEESPKTASSPRIICSAETRPGGCRSTVPNTQATEAEQRLAEKFAPIVYLKEQDEDCDSNGEPYDPAPVELVLDNPVVTLRRTTDGREELIVTEAPTSADLFDKPDGYFLDYPGNPRRPRCSYEQDYKLLRDEYPRVAYAHIQREPGFAGLVLQYWFFYYFNDWNNTHEGDWELIQLIFGAETVEEALQQDPVRVAYAQHASGERSDWDDSKLQKEDGRPVVYVAAGSHASQIEPGVYFGLGEDGAGFGCDNASGPHRRVPLEARLLPDEVLGPTDPYAWLEYEGQWGQLDKSYWNGPGGPTTKEKWHRPFTWEAGLRDGSVKVPGGGSISPNAINVFCDVVSFGSFALSAYTRAPYLVGGSASLAFLIAVGIVYLGRTTSLRGARPLPVGASLGLPLVRQRDFWQIVRASASIYRRNWRVLLLIGAFYVPIGWVTSGAHALISGNPPLEPAMNLFREYPATNVALALLLGSAQTALASVIVTGAVIVALAEIDAGRSCSVTQVYGVVWRRLGSLLGAYIRSAFHVLLFTLTLVGVPWAIQRIVRWYFIPQAVLLEGKEAKEALSASANVVAGSWWRSFGITFIVGWIGLATGPTIAIFFLLFTSASLTFVNGISTLVYVALIPFVATALTLLYSDLRTRRET